MRPALLVPLAGVFLLAILFRGQLAAAGSDHKVVPLPVGTVDPQVSSEDPAALGITELIDRGSTSFAGSIPK